MRIRGVDVLDVRVGNYGNYSSDNYGSCRVIDVGCLSFYYSYKTIVAFKSREGLVISTNEWSKTTGKHLNWINEDKSKRIPREEFEKKLNKVLAEYDVVNVVEETKEKDKQEPIESRYIIVNYLDRMFLSDVGIVTTEDGEPMVFDKKWKAKEYAEKELNKGYEIVELKT